MHLPWIQVHKTAEPRWRTLGKFLDVPESHARGIAQAVWDWAFEIAPEGDFSGRVPDAESIAAAADWPIDDAARLVHELERAGFVSTSPELRVRGLDIYVEAWVRNGNDRNGRRALIRLNGGQVPEISLPPRSYPGVTPELPRCQTQTQTHKKTTTLSGEPDPEPPPASFLVVFEHWRHVMGHPDAKPIDKRRKAVAARMREGYTAEQLKRAIDGCARTPHNMGENDRHERFDELELICRNGAQVERFMRNATGPPAASAAPRVLSESERKNLYESHA